MMSHLNATWLWLHSKRRRIYSTRPGPTGAAEVVGRAGWPTGRPPRRAVRRTAGQLGRARVRAAGAPPRRIRGVRPDPSRVACCLVDMHKNRERTGRVHGQSNGIDAMKPDPGSGHTRRLGRARFPIHGRPRRSGDPHARPSALNREVLDGPAGRYHPSQQSTGS